MKSIYFRAFAASAVLISGSALCQAAPPTPAKSVHAKSVKPAALPASKSTAKVYECPDCHDKFTESEAKKDGMKCTCCQTRLVKIKAQPTPKSKTSKG